MVVACAPGHPLARRTDVDPALLAGESSSPSRRARHPPGGRSLPAPPRRRRQGGARVRQHREHQERHRGPGPASPSSPSRCSARRSSPARSTPCGSRLPVRRPLGIIHRRHHRLASSALAFIELLQANGAAPALWIRRRTLQTQGHARGRLQKVTSAMTPSMLPPGKGSTTPATSTIVRRRLSSWTSRVAIPRHPREGPADPRQPRAPGGVRQREEHRRRGRRPLQIPHAFLAASVPALGIALPALGDYGVGLVFLPTEAPTARSASTPSSRSSARKGRPSSAGATCPPTTR